MTSRIGHKAPIPNSFGSDKEFCILGTILQKQFRYAIFASMKMGLIQKKSTEFDIDASRKKVNLADRLSRILKTLLIKR